MTIRIADYFLGPPGSVQMFKDSEGKPIFSFQTIPDGMGKWKLRQHSPAGAWQCDWLLRVEPDGSLTEYGDDYPDGKLRFVKGHEISWAMKDSGTLWPNLLTSSFSQYGSWGTFLVMSMLQADGNLNIYMEQKFQRTERSTYVCQQGKGITK